MSPKLCARLIALNGWGLVVFGLVLVTTGFPAIDTPGRMLLDVLHWPLNGLPAEPTMEARWMGAVTGGLTVGIGFMHILIFAPLLLSTAVTAKLVRKGVILSLTAWLIVDNVGSIASGAPSNAVFNFIFYLLIVVPLFLVKFPD